MYTIPFAPVSVNSNELNIENIGDCAICAKNEIGQEFYMIIQTDSGITRCMTYGPAIMELPVSPCKCKMSFETLIYDSKKLIGLVSKFLLSTQCVEAELLNTQEVLEFTLSSIGGLIR